MAQIGTYEYPYKRFSKLFIELFNFYDNYTNWNYTVFFNANTYNRTILNFKSEPIVLIDKRLHLKVWNDTLNYQALLNVTDKSKINLEVFKISLL